MWAACYTTPSIESFSQTSEQVSFGLCVWEGSALTDSTTSDWSDRSIDRSLAPFTHSLTGHSLTTSHSFPPTHSHSVTARHRANASRAAPSTCAPLTDYSALSAGEWRETPFNDRSLTRSPSVSQSARQSVTRSHSQSVSHRVTAAAVSFNTWGWLAGAGGVRYSLTHCPSFLDLTCDL